MFIREATQEDYEEVRKTCKGMIEDTNFAGFSRVNFIDYSNYLDKLEKEFPNFIFKQRDIGLSVDKKEK